MMRILRPTLLLPLLGLALASCRDPSGPGPSVPSRVETAGGDLQTAVVGTELPAPITARVLDARGAVVRGQLVDFRVLTGGGSLSAGGAMTSPEGTASVRWTLGTSTADTQRVEVRALDAATGTVLAADTFRAVAQPDAPATLQPVGSATRTGTYGLPLADSLAVVLRDRWGNPVPGAPIAWTVTSGGGSVSPASSVTNGAGVATTRWTLGTSAQPQRVEAAASVAIKTVFSANDGLSPAITLVKVSGDAQTMTVGAPLASPLVVEVRSAGVPLTGVQVMWAPAPGMGSAQPSTSITDAQGRASTAWTLGTQAGPQPLTASTDGANPVVFTATGTAGPPASLEKVSGDGAAAPVGTAIELAARVRDAHGNPVPGAPVHWTTSTGGAFQATPTTTGADGVARARWVLGTAADQRAGAYIELGGGARSEVAFTARATQGQPNQLVISPASLSFGAPGETAQLRVTAYDAIGDPLGEVPAAVRSLDPAVASLSGTTAPATVTAVAAGTTYIIATHGTSADTIEVVVRSGQPGGGALSWQTERGTAPLRPLIAVWGSSLTNLYAVGSAGVVMWHDGTRWTQAPAVTSHPLLDVWGAASGEVFAVGEAGTVLRGTGTSWQVMPVPTTAHLRGVWGTSATDVWAVGDGGTILHLGPGGWTAVPSGTTQPLHAVWGSGPGNVFAVGETGTILRWDGTAWSPMASNTTMLLVGVWGTAPNLVYVMGHDSRLLRWDGSLWTQVRAGIDRVGFVATALGGTGPTSVLTAWGEFIFTGRQSTFNGEVYRFDGTTAHPQTVSPPYAYYHDIWGVNAGLAFVVTTRGDVYRYDGSQWTHMREDPPILRDVWAADASTAFTAGASGVLRRTTAGWQSIGGPAYASVFGASPSLVWAGARDGIYRYDGSGWTKVYAHSGDGIGEIWAAGPTRAYAATGAGAIRWDGAAWSYFGTAGGDRTVLGIWGSGPNDVWLAGGNEVKHFDGTAWTLTELVGFHPTHGTIDTYIQDIWGTGPNDVWAVGSDVFHFDGTSWTEVEPKATLSGTSVWAESPTSVYITASGGRILHYDGTGWTEVVRTGNTAGLESIHGADGHVYAVGEAETILHGRP